MAELIAQGLLVQKCKLLWACSAFLDEMSLFSLALEGIWMTDLGWIDKAKGRVYYPGVPGK